MSIPMVFHESCEKCQAISDARNRSGVESRHYSETWSGIVDGVKCWYDVGIAKRALANCPPINESLLREIDVERFWETSISQSYIVAGHLDHVDLRVPVILATSFVDERGAHTTVIDGIHRIARAHRDGIATLKAIIFAEEFSRSIEIPAEEAVLNELAQEILATGGTLEWVHGKLLLSGGRPVRSTADDHLYRAVLLAQINRGPVEIPLPLPQGR